MEIDPRIQAQMFLAAFSLGLGAALLCQMLQALRTVLGAYLPAEDMRALYERSLPILHRPLGFPQRRARAAWCFLISFFSDVALCLACTAGILLLLYDYNCGAWRLSLPLLFLLGFLLFRAGTARLLARWNAYLAWGLALALCYLRALLLLPVRGLAHLALCAVLRPCRRCAKKLYTAHRCRVSERLCRAQLALARRGAISKEGMMSDVKT